MQEQTRLLIAAQKGDIEEVNKALLNGAPVDCKDDVRNLFICHTAVQTSISCLSDYLSICFRLLSSFFFSLILMSIFERPLSDVL